MKKHFWTKAKAYLGNLDLARAAFIAACFVLATTIGLVVWTRYSLAYGIAILASPAAMLATAPFLVKKREVKNQAAYLTGIAAILTGSLNAANGLKLIKNTWEIVIRDECEFLVVFSVLGIIIGIAMVLLGFFPESKKD